MIKENKFIKIIKYLKELEFTEEDDDRYFIPGSLCHRTIYNYNTSIDSGNISIIKIKNKIELRLMSLWNNLTIDIIGDSIYISNYHDKQLFKISDLKYYHDSISFSLEHDILKIKESIFDIVIEALDIKE